MNNIAALRKAKGFTQKELAEKLNITQGSLSAWETGRFEPALSDIKSLCEILDCSSDYLLGRDIVPRTETERNINNIYFHLAKEMEEMKLPESDINEIMEFARYIKHKNQNTNK